MRILDIIRFATRNFFRRKARSLLTILGVVIGTMSVVIMLSIGQALDVGYQKQIEQWGSLTQITVNTSWNNTEAPKLTDDLVEQLRAMEHVVAVNPVRYMSAKLIKGRTETWTQITSVDAGAMELFGYKLTLGRYMERDGSYELVMTYNVPFEFRDPKSRDYTYNPPYDWETQTINALPFDPTQETIKLTSDSYTEPGKPKPKQYKVQVVGVLEYKMSSDFYGVLMDGAAFDKLEKELQKAQGDSGGGGGGGGGVVPRPVLSSSASSGISSVSGKEETDKYSQIFIKVDDMNHVVDVQKIVTEWGLQAYSAMDSLESMKEQSRFIQYILGGIGLVAFLVAALGIANTMIMSTYERTREIGIMKVMGCKLGDILNMFLCEAAIIGFFGGVLGVTLSLGASFVLNTFIGGSAIGLTSYTGENYDMSIIPVWLMLAGLAFTTIVGVVSGLYPSIRAMRMSALEAIKNE